MLKITQAPDGPVQAKQSFIVQGTASPSDAGKTLTLTIDNQFKTTGPSVRVDGTWQVNFSFQQTGNRELEISLGSSSVEVMIQVVADVPRPRPVPRVQFTNPPQRVKAEESVVFAGQADQYNDGDQLVLRADRRVELARPRVQAGRWQATTLFRQTGRRLIEIIGSEQDRAEITVEVQPADLQIFPRSLWINQTTPTSLPNLQPRRITIHHTALSPTLAATVSQAEEIQRMRRLWEGNVRGNGWSDIGYHFVIMPSGRIYEARSETKRGAHDVINDGLGVAFDGVYTRSTITQGQFNAAVELCLRLCQRYNLLNPVTPVPTPTADFGTRNLPLILGHRDRVSTECPGSAGGTTVRLEEIRRSVQQRLQTSR